MRIDGETVFSGNNLFIDSFLIELENIIDEGGNNNFSFISAMNKDLVKELSERLRNTEYNETDDDVFVADIEHPQLCSFMFTNGIYSEFIESGVTNVKDECLDPVFIVRLPCHEFIVFAIEFIKTSAMMNASRLKRYLITSDLDL